MPPLPARVGISEQTEAPQSKAKSRERFAHCNPFLLGEPGRPDQDEDSQVDSSFVEKIGGAAELLQRHLLVQPLQNFWM